MISFTINNSKLFSENLNTDIFEVRSVPKSYKVIWENSSPVDAVLSEYEEGDIILMDKYLHDIYPIQNKPVFLIEAREDNKNINKILEVVDFLLDSKFNKGNKLLVVGGGIIQDIGAFVGAAYKRGVDWTLFPSTLVSMCDSCIGGKTGINHKDSKNQLALFSSPHKVVICPEFIRTLHEEDIKSGLGEVLKLFAIGGDYFIQLYEEYVKGGEVKQFEYYKSLILGALSIKKAVIECDEFEFDERRSLNYGHTLGHALESLSEYRIPHGQAVALGMLLVNRINKTTNLSLDRLCLDLVGNIDLSTVDLQNLKSILLNDKKATKDQISFIFVDQPGKTSFKSIKISDNFVDEVKFMIEKMHE